MCLIFKSTVISVTLKIIFNNYLCDINIRNVLFSKAYVLCHPSGLSLKSKTELGLGNKNEHTHKQKQVLCSPWVCFPCAWDLCRRHLCARELLVAVSKHSNKDTDGRDVLSAQKAESNQYFMPSTYVRAEACSDNLSDSSKI